MTELVDVTQSPEYLQLLQVSEEMEADYLKQLAEKDALFAQRELENQQKIAQLEAELAGRDKELESYVEEVEAANQAALQAKVDEAAALKRALDEAEMKLRQPNSSLEVCELTRQVVSRLLNSNTLFASVLTKWF
jgi:hypothetical protein